MATLYTREQVEAAARAFWAWEREQVARNWGVVMNTWEDMPAKYQRLQMEMVDMRIWGEQHG